MAFKKIVGKLIFSGTKAGLILLCFGIAGFASTWLYIRVVVRGEVVRVPDLVGLTLEEARDVVESHNLVFTVDEGVRVHSSVIPRDRVYLQTPRPELVIKAGRQVEVTFSAGPEKKLIPRLEGETLQFSETLLSDVGKKVEMVSRVPSTMYPKGRVLTQSIKPGEDPGLLQTMAVAVSDGKQEPWYVTPDLIGRDYAVVKEFLDRHEIRMITKYRSDDPELGPVVLKQIPEPGYPINRAQTISLTVNKDF